MGHALNGFVRVTRRFLVVEVFERLIEQLSDLRKGRNIRIGLDGVVHDARALVDLVDVSRRNANR